MNKLILIKYGELTTKKDNINQFIKTLKENIIFKLGENIDILFDKGRMFIKPHEEDFLSVLQKLRTVFGIHEIVIAYEINSLELSDINNVLLDLLKSKEFKSFKVETKRSNKKINKTSLEISRDVGSFILKNIKDIKVDVHNPDICIHIELRSNNSYIYFDSVKGIGGYPVSILGKGILMLSGGIDSPVSGYLAMKRGVKLEALYFESPPHTSMDAKNKVISLARSLSVYNNEIKLHVINFCEIQEAIYKNIPHAYLITIMRRMMYRIAEIIAYRNNAKVIINGESIGQVASQTLTSMKAINEVVKLPVIRPVACFDKLEIIEIAKKINTYETSILPYEDCCTIFVPKHPIINPDIKKCIEYEKLIPYEELIYKAIKNHEIIKVSCKENSYNDLL